MKKTIDNSVSPDKKVKTTILERLAIATFGVGFATAYPLCFISWKPFDIFLKKYEAEPNSVSNDLKRVREMVKGAFGWAYTGNSDYWLKNPHIKTTYSF